MANDERSKTVPAIAVCAFLGMPEPVPIAEAHGYREAAPVGLDGSWVGAFAQAFFGPAIVSPWQATFDGQGGHSSDRHGRATLSLVCVDGTYVEFTKTYELTRHTFRYRGRLEGTSLVGYWEAPDARGAFALRRTDFNPNQARRLPLRRRLGGWIWVPGLILSMLAGIHFQDAVPPTALTTGVLLVYVLAFIVPPYYAHSKLVRRLVLALGESGPPAPKVRVAPSIGERAHEGEAADEVDDREEATDRKRVVERK